MRFLSVVTFLTLSLGLMACPARKQATEQITPPTAEAPAAQVTTQGSIQDKYIAAMSEVGCNNIIDESNSAAQSIFQKHGISYDDIREFRRGSDMATMQTVAGEIAKRVAACH